MRVATQLQMKTIEQMGREHGVLDFDMMQNAGFHAAEAVIERYKVAGKKVVVLSGKGNNGGDGFAFAERILKEGAKVCIGLVDNMVRSEHAKAMLARIPQVTRMTDDSDILQAVKTADYIVDAIYGTGFQGEIRQEKIPLFQAINQSSAVKISLDLPSGVKTDDATVATDAVRADITIAFDSLKPAHVINPAMQYCGETQVVSIGVLEEWKKQIPQTVGLIEEPFVFSHLKKRVSDSNKSTYGKLLNIAGCRSFQGAALMSTMAALRSGVGYVTLASVQKACDVALSSMPQVVMMPLKEDESGFIAQSEQDDILKRAERSDAVILGCGLGRSAAVENLVYQVVSQIKCPMIVDADGLNALAKNINILDRAKGPIVLTPHIAEMARLTGLEIAQIKNNRVGVATAFAAKHRVVLVLKDNQTIVATPDGKVWVNTTGNAGLAKAGSGDVLSGIIGSFLAQGVRPEYAAACGVFLHGLSADMTARRLSQYYMQPTDILEDLSKIFVKHEF